MNFSIREIIEIEAIETEMQLVISPNRDFAAGIEALSRGIHPITNEHIPPKELLKEAQKEGVRIELERLMVKKALETFKPIHDEKPEMLLFVNISAFVAEEAIRTNFIDDYVKHYHLLPQNIFFDILEFEFSKLEVVQAFAEYYRALGYFMCLDDLGNGYSNIDKILYLMPDIVKININALKRLDHLIYAEQFMKVLKHLTEEMGILIVAKGIENESDVQYAIESGAQFMQGFFISKPQDLTTPALETIVVDYRRLIGDQHTQEQNLKEMTRVLTAKSIRIVKEIKEMLTFVGDTLVIQDSAYFFKSYPMIENIWFLDEKGFQVGKTLINDKTFDVKSASMFQVYNPGANFSSKELFTQLSSTILEVWITQPYRSILTNNICIGGSIKLETQAEEQIICLNINFDALSHYRE